MALEYNLLVNANRMGSFGTDFIDRSTKCGVILLFHL